MHWTLAEVAQRGCGDSNLEVIQNLAGLHPWQLVLVDSALSRGVGLDGLQRLLPTSTILQFCNILK